MKKKLIILSCFLFGFVLFMALVNPNPNNSKKSAADTPQSEPNSNLVYVVKEYNGNIAIFEENSTVPFKITDIRLSELPEGDKKLLNKGIHASNSKELNCILEDYCS